MNLCIFRLVWSKDIEFDVFIFQGVTYDTGGADIKAGGVMAGMHRYKTNLTLTPCIRLTFIGLLFNSGLAATE